MTSTQSQEHVNEDQGKQGKTASKVPTMDPTQSVDGLVSRFRRRKHEPHVAPWHDVLKVRKHVPFPQIRSFENDSTELVQSDVANRLANVGERRS